MNTNNDIFSLMPCVLLIGITVLMALSLYLAGTLETLITVANMINTAIAMVWYLIDAVI